MPKKHAMSPSKSYEVGYRRPPKKFLFQKVGAAIRQASARRHRFRSTLRRNSRESSTSRSQSGAANE